VLDSRIGALDRTMGFLFGLARGLLIMVVAFIFFDWLVPAKSQPEGVRNARSRVVLQGTGEWLMSLLPEDPETTILKRLKKKKPEEEGPEAPGQRSDRAGGYREAILASEYANVIYVIDRRLGVASAKRRASAA
jgi:membrane protein required for colicin V production